MVGVWLLFAFVIPAAVHQWVSMVKPANLMTDLIDSDRDKKQELYDLPDSVAQMKINKMFPEIVNSPVAQAQDSTKIAAARNDSYTALVNEMKKESIIPIEETNLEKNQLIRSSYWLNPVSFFQKSIQRYCGNAL